MTSSDMNDFNRLFDVEVRLAVYSAFLDHGHAPTTMEMARELGASVVDVEQALRRLHDAHMLVLAPGSTSIWMAMPFSSVPTDFVVSCGNRRWWANCAWDALAVPFVAGAAARVDTHCPDCGESIELSVSPDRVSDESLLLHMALPPKRWWDDIGFA